MQHTIKNPDPNKTDRVVVDGVQPYLDDVVQFTICVPTWRASAVAAEVSELSVVDGAYGESVRQRTIENGLATPSNIYTVDEAFDYQTELTPQEQQDVDDAEAAAIEQSNLDLKLLLGKKALFDLDNHGFAPGDIGDRWRKSLQENITLGIGGWGVNADELRAYGIWVKQTHVEWLAWMGYDFDTNEYTGVSDFVFVMADGKPVGVVKDNQPFTPSSAQPAATPQKPTT